MLFFVSRALALVVNPADLMTEAAADHVPAVLSLIEGLSQKKPTPGYFIQISGTGILNDVPNGFGMYINTSDNEC